VYYITVALLMFALPLGSVVVELFAFVIGILSIFNVAWVMPAATAGGLFYGLAGSGHVVKRERNALETTAMVSDLFIFAVMLVCVIILLIRPSR
jgi:hypothetical protein